jgi:beta-glucanase (GH16 family)
MRKVMIAGPLVAGALAAPFLFNATIGKKVTLVNDLPPIQAPRGYAWHEVFDDEFSGTTLDTSKWVTCYDWHTASSNGCTNGGNQELEWYVPQQVSVSNGSASLTAVASGITGSDGSKSQEYPYQSGMISTGRETPGTPPKWSGTYGYYEARMKVPTGKGLWPAFWLLPTDSSWPPEIDMMELLGSKPNQIIMTYHWKDSAQNPQKDYTIYTGADFTSGWHTYAVDWEPSSIDWYVDGVKRKSVRSDTVPSKPMEIILDLAVGGSLPGTPAPSTQFPAQAQIDYVRAYQLAPN